MSHKKKSGLQRGLSEIVQKQTAPKQDASELSRGLIGKFTEPKTTQSTQSTQSTHGTQSTLSTHPAPMRDFQKVANSITREAVPAGVFKGKCKQIYDFLYSRTRGAIVPSRSVTLTRQAIMDGSHVGSTKTLFLNLRHLRGAGLITWTECEGTHGGNDYTVFLPEEALGTQGTQGTLGTLSDPSHFLPRVPMVESTQGTQGLSTELSTFTHDPNTLIKDKERIDDEAAQLGELFRRLERDVIGKNSASLQHWQDLRELLVTELKIAAARTTISNVPAFLTEHLRRRLWKVDKKQASEIAAAGQANQAQANNDKEKHKCPDCAGTGFWYPEGLDKGVTRCMHLNLPTVPTIKETD
ncbi:MAG TPA: hypothetical protein VF703_05180 [Pyrinomonadaceae bacterium]|jgi:hypothetical protein